MKILVITYCFPPDLNPRAFRWGAVAEALRRQGHVVDVVCASGHAGAETQDGVGVHRVPDWLSAVKPQEPQGTQATATQIPRGAPAALKQRLREPLRQLWRLLRWPDYAMGWVIPAVRAARRLLRNERYDWVITVSHPFTGHWVGMLALKGPAGPRWLVDIGDPFHLMPDPAPNNQTLYGRLNRWVEARLLARADAVSVTTDTTRALYEAHFPAAVSKIRVIPPLLSLPRLPEPVAPRSDGIIRLVFAGTLYRNLRSPKFLIACLEGLIAAAPALPLELHFYGAVNDCGPDLGACSVQAKARIHIHGLVGREVAARAMAEADVLVNIGNKSESQLASKVVEYMTSGRPILNLTSIDLDTSGEALGDYPTLTIRESSAGPEPQVVDQLLEFVRNPPIVAPEYAERVRESFSTGRIAGMYESVIQDFREVSRRHDSDGTVR